MKVIKITPEITINNLLTESTKGITPNGFKIFDKLPDRWGTSEGIINNFTAVPSSDLFTLGFRDLVIPEFDASTQKINLDNIDDTWYNNTDNKYYVPIINLAQEELDLILETVESNDVSSKLEAKFIKDGRESYIKLKQYLRRQLDKGVITQAQFNNIYTPIRRPLVWLNTGDWDIAKTELDAITPPTNATLLDILNTIKSKVDTYVTNNL